MCISHCIYLSLLLITPILVTNISKKISSLTDLSSGLQWDQKSPTSRSFFLESQDLPAQLRSIRGWNNWESSSLLSAGMQPVCYGFWWAFCNLQIKTKQNQPTKSFPETFWISSGYKNVQASKHIRPVFLHSTPIAYLYPKAKMKSLSHTDSSQKVTFTSSLKNSLPKLSFGR